MFSWNTNVDGLPQRLDSSAQLRAKQSLELCRRFVWIPIFVEAIGGQPDEVSPRLRLPA